MHDTWILVADRARARLFAHRAEAAALDEIADFVNPEGRLPGKAFTRGHAQVTNESMGNTRHAIEPHTTIDEKVEMRFARRLDHALQRGRVEHRYERLILVAPPHFLGTLNRALGKQVCDCVATRVAKDMSTLPAAEILVRLAPRFNEVAAPG